MSEHAMISDLTESEVSPLEAQWKQRVLPRVLGTLDLSMIAVIDSAVPKANQNARA